MRGQTIKLNDQMMEASPAQFLFSVIWGTPDIPHDGLTKLQKCDSDYAWIRALDMSVNGFWYVLKYVNKTILDKDKIYASLLFAIQQTHVFP